jgi:hypothetical protein
VKTSKPVAAPTQADRDKPLPVLRNPYLDGIDPLIKAQKTGARSLRIDRTTPAPMIPTSSARIQRPAV